MKIVSRLMLIMSILMLIAAAVAAQQPPSTGAPAKEPPKAQPAPQPQEKSQAERAGIVVARIGTRTITVGDIEKLVAAAVPPQFLAQFNDPTRKQQFIDSILDSKVYAMEAKEQGLTEKPDIKIMLENYIERVLASELIKTLTDNLHVSSEEIQKYYDEKKADFTLPERIKAKRILVRTEEECSKVKAELDKGGNWDELAKQYSVDKSNANRGGELGYIKKGDLMDKALDELAFTMKPGETSNCVKTVFGYQIVKVEDKKAPEIQPREAVEQRIVSQILNQKRKELVDQLREKLFVKFNVTVYKDKYNEVQFAAPSMPGSPAAAEKSKADAKKPEQPGTVTPSKQPVQEGQSQNQQKKSDEKK